MATTQRASRRTGRNIGARPTAITKIGDSPSYFNWMVVGDGGVGKTVFGSTAPRNLFLSFEVQGTESAKVMGNTEGDELIVRTRQQFVEAYEYFEYGSGCDDYSWVIIDSGDEMEEVHWKSHLRNMKESKSTRSEFKAELQDYNFIGNQIKAAVDDFNKLPINVLYLVKPMPVITTDDEGEEVVDWLPMLGSPKNGNLARKICGKVSMVGYLEPKQKKEGNKTVEWRRMYVSPRDGMHAKNRYGWGPYIDDPTIPALVQLAQKAMQGTSSTRRTTTRRRRPA